MEDNIIKDLRNLFRLKTEIKKKKKKQTIHQSNISEILLDQKKRK